MNTKTRLAKIQNQKHGKNAIQLNDTGKIGNNTKMNLFKNKMLRNGKSML